MLTFLAIFLHKNLPRKLLTAAALEMSASNFLIRQITGLFADNLCVMNQ